MTAFLFIAIIMIIAGVMASSAGGGSESFGDPKYICTDCGSQINPVKHTQGSFIMEIGLWLLLLVPGLIYSIWRITSKRLVCPKCKSEKFIPLDSPRGQAVLKQLGNAGAD